MDLGEGVIEVCWDILGGEDGVLNIVGVKGQRWVKERYIEFNRVIK